jgi:hypothetical protein
MTTRNPVTNAVTSAGTLAQRPPPSEILVGSTYFSQDVPRLDLCVVTSPGVFAWRILDSGGAGIGGDPNSILFEDPTGTNAITNPRLVVEPPDVFGRPQIWDNRSLLGKGPVLRQGSWQADGDPSSQASEGYVTYGANALGLGPDNTQGGYGRVKSRRMGLAQIIPGINGGALFYAIRLGTEVGDVDGIRMLDDTNDRTFDVTRSSGTIVFGSGAGLGSARMFGNASGPLHNSNAGIQYSSLIANRAQLRANAYGAHAGVAGITGFKSRGVTIGALAPIVPGDVMFRATALGVSGALSLNLAGLVSLQAAIVGPAFVSTDLEVALATSTAGTRPCWTAKGETGEWIGSVAGGIVRENLGGALIGLGPTIITWTPGAVAPLAPNVVDSWAALMLLLPATRGPVRVFLDGSIAPTIVPLGVWNLARVTFTGPATNGAAPAVLVMTDGAQLVDVAGFDRVTLASPATVVSPLAFVTSDFLVLTNAANLSNLGAAPMVRLAGGFALKVTLENSSQISAGRFLASVASFFECSILSGSAVATDCLTADGPSGLQCFFDESSAFPTMAGDASGSWNTARRPLGTLPNTLTIADGATGQIPWGSCFSWDDAVRMLAYTHGPVDLALSRGTTTVPILPATYDLEGRASVVASDAHATTTLNITDGAQILHCAAFRGAGPLFRIQGNGAGSSPLAWTPAGAVAASLAVSDGAEFLNVGVVPMIQLVAGDVLDVRMDVGGATGINFCDAPLAAEITVRAYTGSVVNAGALTGAGVVSIVADASVGWGAQPAAAALTVTVQNFGVLHGAVTLGAGTTAAIPARGLKASSVISVGFVTPIPGAGGLTRYLVALGADRVFGAATGEFKISALLADGTTINVLDLSNCEYTITL